MHSSKDKKLKVGFDLDGVILYNPLRIVRPFLKFVRQRVLHKRSTGSYTPKTPIEEFIGKIYVKSSIFTAPGLDNIFNLVKTNEMEAFIITARHSSYEKYFHKSISKVNSQGLFSGSYYNQHDLEPYEFKKTMFEKLNLDLYVDDNLDVVLKLEEFFPDKVYWLTNIADKHIEFKNKYESLTDVAKNISLITKTS